MKQYSSETAKMNGKVNVNSIMCMCVCSIVQKEAVV